MPNPKHTERDLNQQVTHVGKHPFTTLWDAVNLTKKYHSAFLTEDAFINEEERTISVITEEVDELGKSPIKSVVPNLDGLADIIVTVLQYVFVRGNAFRSSIEFRNTYLDVLMLNSLDLTPMPNQDILSETSISLHKRIGQLFHTFCKQKSQLTDQHLACMIMHQAKQLSFIYDEDFSDYFLKVAHANWDKRISFKNTDKCHYHYDVSVMIKKTTEKYKQMGVEIEFVRNDLLQCYMPISAKKQIDLSGKEYCKGKCLKRYGWCEPERWLADIELQ